MSERRREHVAVFPLPGDIFFFTHRDYEDQQVIRVLVTIEGSVGFKHFGEGLKWMSKQQWKMFLESVASFELIRGGDKDFPF